MSESIISIRKYYKRNKVLNIIRSGVNVSRFDVKKQSLYSIATVADIIEGLIDEGLVYEENCNEVRVGRKPTWLRLNPDGAYFVGVEFNSQMLHCAMLNMVGEIVWTSSEMISRKDSAEKLIGCIIRHIRQAIRSAAGGQARIRGICVGVPRFVAREKSLALAIHSDNSNLSSIRHAVEEQFGLPCYVDNNINVMAFAYKWLHFRGDVKDYAFVSMRTGVRVAPFINNELILSRSGFSGELGHMRVSGTGRICTCGRYGCLNTEVSSAGLMASILAGLQMDRFAPLLELAGGDPDKITVDLLCQSILAGHEDSVSLMQRCAGFLGEALSAVVNILAPEVIVLSGNLAAVGDAFVNEVYQSMRPYVVQDNYKDLQICSSAFDKSIGAIGAAAMVMQEVFEFINQSV